MKKCRTRAGYSGTIRDFLQRAAIGTSFDVSWSLVAQAVPENELFLLKNVNLPESLCIGSKFTRISAHLGVNFV